MKFISKNHFLRIFWETNWAALYKLGNPKRIKYFDLGTHPAPGFGEYVFNENVDTSWQAHIMVAGQYNVKANGNWNPPGIIVYGYDPKAQTLKKLWSEKIHYSWFKRVLFKIKLFFGAHYRI